MSKEKFVERVINRIAEEYGVEPHQLQQHQTAIGDAAPSESSITDDELNLLISGKSDEDGRAVQAKYPVLNSVSLKIVEELENQDLENDDEEEEDEDDEDDEDEDEESDDDEDDED